MKTATRCSAPARGHHSASARAVCPVHGVPQSAGAPPAPAAPPGHQPEFFEHFDEDGLPHCEDGPAKRYERLTSVACADGIAEIVPVLVEEWCRHGKVHRDDGPATSEWLPDGTRVLEVWAVEDLLHREGGSAQTTWHSNGQVASALWQIDGQYHREDGPVDEAWNEQGVKIREDWWLHDTPHRADGPAEVARYDNGTTSREMWCDTNGLEHREDGPSCTTWNEDGSVSEESWAFHGEPMSELQRYAPDFGVARGNVEALDYLEGHRPEDLSPRHPAVIVALAMFPGV